MPENTEQNNLNMPTDEELNAMERLEKLTELNMFEPKFRRIGEDEEEMEANSLITFKCKPTYNFQSIEFEYTCSKDELEEMFELYKALVNGLMAIAPAQPTAIPAKELASAKQKEIMDKFGIKYKASTTREEAQALIKESIEAVSKK